MKGGTVIFSRNGGSGGRHAAGESRRASKSSRSPSGSSSSSSAPASSASASSSSASSAAASSERDSASGRRLAGGSVDPSYQEEFGPYDISEAPDGDYLDLGSLRIPTIEGVEVRVQANNEGAVQQVVLGAGASALQLAVFAAPRGEGIWDEVRANIRKSLIEDGNAVEEVRGDYGHELRVQVRAEQGMADLRFIGVDGPRWMVRAIYQGPAAREPSAAGPLVECLRGLVVDRGKEAMPAEEALPLRLPREMADAATAQLAAQAADPAEHPGVPHANGSLAQHANGSPSPSPNPTGGHPAAGSDQQRRPSPRPRRPE